MSGIKKHKHLNTKFSKSRECNQCMDNSDNSTPNGRNALMKPLLLEGLGRRSETTCVFKCSRHMGKKPRDLDFVQISPFQFLYASCTWKNGIEPGSWWSTWWTKCRSFGDPWFALAISVSGASTRESHRKPQEMTSWCWGTETPRYRQQILQKSNSKHFVGCRFCVMWH